MKNLLEKFVLGFLYGVTVWSSIRMYAELISDTQVFSFSAVVNLVVIGFCLSFLAVLSFILLFTKRPNE
jgi:hypothetical protein